MHHRCFVHRWPRGRLQEAIIVSYTSCRSSVCRSFSWSSMDARTPSVGLSSMQMTKPPVRHFKTGQRYRWRLSYSRLSRPLARVKHELLVGGLTFVMRATWPRIADNDWRCPLCRTVRVKYFLTVEITRHSLDGDRPDDRIISEKPCLISQSWRLSPVWKIVIIDGYES